MTPKEKAKSLVEKFKDYAYVVWNGGNDEMTNENSAKQYALICVDEILLDKKVGYSKDIIEEKKYWLEVKQEIEKL